MSELTNDWHSRFVERQRRSKVDKIEDGSQEGESVYDQLLTGVGREQVWAYCHQHNNYIKKKKKRDELQFSPSAQLIILLLPRQGSIITDLYAGDSLLRMNVKVTSG